MTAADKIADAKGPERIWAHGKCMGRLGRPLPPGPSCHWATWETRVGDPNHATEYVRADLADAQAQENAKLREVALIVAKGPHQSSCPKAHIQMSEYRCTCVKVRARAALAQMESNDG